MHKLFQNKLGLTRQGAEGLTKSTWASFAVHLMNFVPSFFLLYSVNRWIQSGSLSQPGSILVSLLILLVFYYLLNKEYILMYDETYKEAANLRIELVEQMTKLPLSYFTKHDLSDLAQTFIADIFAMEHALSHSVGKICSFFMSFVLIGLMLLAGCWQLGICVIVPTLLYLGMVLLSRKIQVRIYDRYYAQLRENSEAFQEAIEHQQDIKSFRLQDRIYGRLYHKMEQTEKIRIESELTAMVPLLLGGVCQNLSLAVVLIVGTTLMLRGNISLLYVLGYSLTAIKLKDGVSSMAGNISEMYYLSPMLRRIKEVRQEKAQEGKPQELSSYQVEFQSVDFAYDEDTPVLNQCSFLAKQGEVTALVGRSGCGKTSILRLISRLYDPDRGRILIDGKEIGSIEIASLHQYVSMVFQNVNLFNTSVLENIRLGRPEATDEEVKEAARQANCSEFVERLPQGYDTHIGENGTKLSGGERQRLSIARAFLKNAPILLLDEIASSLDVENEQKIQSALNRLMQGKTVVIISHRLKSIQNVDQIIVLDEGRVLSKGKHKELVQNCSVYRDLLEKTILAQEFSY